jgi:hypothetical protein
MTVKAGHAAATIAAAIAVVVAAGPTSLAQSEPKTSSAKTKPAPVKLPAAVRTAFGEAYPQATIKHVSHETENGQEQYEIESVDHGLRLDVNYKPDGSVIVIEQEVAAADVPAAVMAAVTARYPKASVTRRERATEHATQYFELGLKGAPVKEVQLTPEGQWISPKLQKK